ncbi:MAG TPA: ROK family protein [Bryobacteraceae bacterium]|jgi:polyphosphate glucokinase
MKAEKKKQKTDPESAAAPPPTETSTDGPLTLAIDIGGTGIKSAVLDAGHKPKSAFNKLPTPHPATPKAILDTIAKLASQEGPFDRIACGFPGVIKHGVILTAANLSPKCIGFHLENELAKRFGKSARVANDAAVQGYAAVEGKGLELAITLGTGVGSALFLNGKLVASLELAHTPFRNNKSYEEVLGNKALEKNGKKQWNKRLQEAIENWSNLFRYDYLYLGGGNSTHITFKLPANVKIKPNKDGIYGGVLLWQD